MKLQQYRFKFLTISKKLAIAILFVGFIFSVLNIIDFSKSRRIEAMNGPQFRQFVSDYKYYKSSLRSLEAVAKKALEITPQELDASERANREILKKKESCLDCQNRIVFFDLNKNEALTNLGLEALHSSYEISPYGDADLMKWRLEVSSKFWLELDEELKKSSLMQITALSQYRSGRNWLRNFDTEIDSIKNRIARITN